MTNRIPLIRAGALIPMMRWMTANRLPVENFLREVDLGYATFVDPNQPIPLRNTAQLFVNVSKTEGPDVCCKIVSDASIRDLALIGRVVLGTTTPRAALERVAVMMPYHCSHEILTIQPVRDGILVGEGWSTRLDDIHLHTIHQFFASIIRSICSMTLAPEPLLERIEIVPHPDFGLAHLQKWFPVAPVASKTHFLKISIKAPVADRRFFKIARDRTDGRLPPEAQPLMGDGRLSSSAKTVLALLLLDGTPTIDQLATSAGLSRRTLQRQLAAEDTSFSDLLEEVRLETALQQFEKGNGSLDNVAAKLGYARQSTLTRAVRRWTGQTPSSLRRDHD